jgi:hypothetical protein
VLLAGAVSKVSGQLFIARRSSSVLAVKRDA